MYYQYNSKNIQLIQGIIKFVDKLSKVKSNFLLSKCNFKTYLKRQHNFVA